LLLAKLVNPQPDERIADPACGSGSLLIKCGQQVGANDFSLYGQENNGSTWALCRMNMFLHGMDDARIEWADAIRNRQFKEKDRLMKFEVVVANPPFSLDKWGQETASVDPFERFDRGVPSKSKGDYAFILHMIATISADSEKIGIDESERDDSPEGIEAWIRQYESLKPLILTDADRAEMDTAMGEQSAIRA